MVIEDTLRDELAAFPRKTGITSNDLRALLARIDWRSDGAAGIARQRLAQRLDRAVSAAEVLAEEKGIPLDRLWRNLIASASKGDDGIYGMLLDRAERRGQNPLGPTQGEIRKGLAQVDRTTASLVDFLGAAGEPSPALSRRGRAGAARCAVQALRTGNSFENERQLEPVC